MVIFLIEMIYGCLLRGDGKVWVWRIVGFIGLMFGL